MKRRNPFVQRSQSRYRSPWDKEMCFALLLCLAMLINHSDCCLNKNCHKAGLCSRPPHAHLSESVPALSSWSMGQGKYPSFTQCTPPFLCKYKYRHVKLSVIIFYTLFSYIFQCQNFLLHEINILKTLPVCLYDSVRNKKTQYVPNQFMWLFCAQWSCSKFDKSVTNYSHRA